jgi:regulator of replication initiation timing
MKLYPDFVFCLPVVSTAKTIEQAMLLEKYMEENKQVIAENAGLKRKLEQVEAENADLAKQFKRRLWNC